MVMVLASIPKTALPNDLTNMSQREVVFYGHTRKGYAHRNASPFVTMG
jgi:hypothetical protein